jgi:hypothetical protein
MTQGRVPVNSPKKTLGRPKHPQDAEYEAMSRTDIEAAIQAKIKALESFSIITGHQDANSEYNQACKEGSELHGSAPPAEWNQKTSDRLAIAKGVYDHIKQPMLLDDESNSGSPSKLAGVDASNSNSGGQHLPLETSLPRAVLSGRSAANQKADHTSDTHVRWSAEERVARAVNYELRSQYDSYPRRAFGTAVLMERQAWDRSIDRYGHADVKEWLGPEAGDVKVAIEVRRYWGSVIQAHGLEYGPP